MKSSPIKSNWLFKENSPRSGGALPRLVPHNSAEHFHASQRRLQLHLNFFLSFLKADDDEIIAWGAWDQTEFFTLHFHVASEREEKS